MPSVSNDHAVGISELPPTLRSVASRRPLRSDTAGRRTSVRLISARLTLDAVSWPSK